MPVKKPAKGKPAGNRDGANHPDHPDTLLAQAGHYIDPATGGVTPPVVVSTTYARGPGYALPEHGSSYSRDGNPTYTPVENLLTALEGGEDAALFSSGLAAGSGLMSLVGPGDGVALPSVLYHGMRRLVLDRVRDIGLTHTIYEAGDSTNLRKAVRPGETKLVLVESPANPTWDVTDIEEAAGIARDAGAMLAVDSTVATPLLTRPLTLGADFVMHSATKYLNGHSDVVAGALVCARKDARWERIRDHRTHEGGVLGPFEAWLLLRGMRTMHLRVARSCETAMAVAKHFDGHSAIERVLYPGLPNHPGHALATRQMQGMYGGMLSLLVQGGRKAALRAAEKARLAIPATSLGGVETLIEHRASVEGPDSPVPENLLRLSVGIENADDLIADLEQALTPA